MERARRKAEGDRGEGRVERAQREAGNREGRR